MARIFLSGAAGFIGSHAVEALLSRGHDVVGLDDFSPYYDVSRKRLNVAEMQEHPRAGHFRMVEGSIEDRPLLRRLFSETRPEVVVHLAALPGVKASTEQPGRYLDVNVRGTLNVLDSAREAETTHVVFASTSSVYGRTDEQVFREDAPADRPLAPYAASKRAAELLAHSYHHLYGLNITVLRFFTVYGPRNRPDMMAHKVLDSMLGGRELPLYDGGQMYRDWTYVGDTVDGIVRAVERPKGYEIINLGRGEPVLLSDFIRHLEKVVGRRAKLVVRPRPEFDMSATQADITKARELLGYQPQTSVQEGVAQLWAWYERVVLATDRRRASSGNVG